MDSLSERVKTTIQSLNLIRQNEHILLAVSGGADSIAMGELLLRLSEVFAVRFSVAHINHGLRGDESDKEEQFVHTWAYRHGLPIHVEKLNGLVISGVAKGNLHAKLRYFRYEALRRIQKEIWADRISIGHTADDVLETMLMNLIRGSGLRGLIGIRAKKRKDIIRPLIAVLHKEIVSFLRREKIAYVDDPSNMDNKYFRVRVRNQLIPLMESWNPRVRQCMLQTAEILREEDDWMESEVQRVTRKLFPDGKIERVTLQSLQQIPRAIRRRCWFHWLGRRMGEDKQLSFKHVALLEELILDTSSAQSLVVPGRWVIWKWGGELFLRTSQINISRQPFVLTGPGIYPLPEYSASIFVRECEKIEQAEWSERACTLNIESGSICLRTRLPGDKVRHQNGHRKLSRFMIDAKIPRLARNRYPLLCTGNDVHWIFGFPKWRILWSENVRGKLWIITYHGSLPI